MATTGEGLLTTDMNLHTLPLQREFLTAQWLDLVMLNYVVDPAMLAPHVPHGTTLDLWKGDAYVSVVGFRFADTRVLGIPVPWHRDFEEINLRFYVTREEPDGIRRGVVFIRELVPRMAIAGIARLLYNEPYRAVPMQHTIAPEWSPGSTGHATDARAVEYAWREQSGWCRLKAHTNGPPVALQPESDEAFITEHYWGYTSQRDGSTMEYHVAHAPWRVWRANTSSLDGPIAATYGGDFAAVFRDAPRSAFVAEGSPITVYRPRRL